MSTFLRVIAGLVMFLGFAGLVGLSVLLMILEINPHDRVDRNFQFSVAVAGSASVLSFGGILWALTRLAYRPREAPAVPDTSALTDRRAPQIRLYSLESALRIMALLQIGIGVGCFIVFWYLQLPYSETPRRIQLVPWLLMTAILSMALACLGGILFALTRLAYPPTHASKTPASEG